MCHAVTPHAGGMFGISHKAAGQHDLFIFLMLPVFLNLQCKQIIHHSERVCLCVCEIQEALSASISVNLVEPLGGGRAVHPSIMLSGRG